MSRIKFYRSAVLAMSCAALLLTLFQVQSRAGVQSAGRVKGYIVSVDLTTSQVFIQPTGPWSVGYLYVVPGVTKITVNGHAHQTINQLAEAVAAAKVVGGQVDCTSTYDGNTGGMFTIVARSVPKP